MSQYPAPGNYPPPAYTLAPPTNAKAIISLVSGIVGLALGFLALWFVGGCSSIFTLAGALVGLPLGYQAKREIADSQGAQGGAGVATAGIVLGWINIALTIGLVVISVISLLILGTAFAWLLWQSGQ